MPHCPPVPTSSWMLCTDRPQFAVGGGLRAFILTSRGGAAGPSAPLLPYSAVFELSADAQKKHTCQPFYTILDIPSAYGIDTRFYSTIKNGDR